MNTSSVIFDLDGTLMDTRPGIAASLTQTASELGLGTVAPRHVAGFIGPPLRQGLQEIFGLHVDEVDRAVEIFRSFYSATGIYDALTYPGVAACLSALSATATLAVATSKPEPYARRLLEAHGLVDFFATVRGATLDGTLSTKSAIIAAVLKELDLQPSQTFMVGDRDQDITGARACSVAPIGVTWGYGTLAELLEAGAIAVVAHPAELFELVGNNLGPQRTPRHLDPQPPRPRPLRAYVARTPTPARPPSPGQRLPIRDP